MDNIPLKLETRLIDLTPVNKGEISSVISYDDINDIGIALLDNGLINFFTYLLMDTRRDCIETICEPLPSFSLSKAHKRRRKILVTLGDLREFFKVCHFEKIANDIERLCVDSDICERHYGTERCLGCNLLFVKNHAYKCTECLNILCLSCTKNAKLFDTPRRVLCILCINRLTHVDRSTDHTINVELPTEKDIENDIELAENYDGYGACIVCSNNRPVCIIMPCMHLCLCSACGKKICNKESNKQNNRTCPICRGSIEAIRRVKFLD